MSAKLLFVFTFIGVVIAHSNAEGQSADPGGTTPDTSHHTHVTDSHEPSHLLDNSHALKADDHGEVTPSPVETFTGTEGPTEEPDYIAQCPSNIDCATLGAECIDCDYENNTDCVYGNEIQVMCTAKSRVQCLGPTEFNRSLICRYCYQTPELEHECTPPIGDSQCRVISAPRERYKANCTVPSHLLCLGRREFYKMKTCDWTSGKRWSTALILSVTVGGFGVDRFYLGLWKEGIGKLFSFGGLGAWTLVDVVLIATGYVGPADGSLYIF